MRTSTAVVFNATERRTMHLAGLAKMVGLHGPISESVMRGGRPRFISRLDMKGFEHNINHLTDSLAALQEARAACVVETDPNYFLLPPKKGEPKKTIAEEGMPLVLDPVGMVKFLIRTRHEFIGYIDDAIALVEKAMALAGVSEDDDPDFWEMDEDADDYVPDFSGGSSEGKITEGVR